MAGRIEIDDVAPVVSGGRFPAKAVVGEVVPVRATVWREGHDAVSATLVVRYHGTAYPRLAEAPVPAVTAVEPVPIEDVVNPPARVKPQRLPMSLGRTPDVFHGHVHPRQRRAVDVPGGRLGRPDRHVAPRRHGQAGRRAGRGRAVQRSADRCSAAGAGRHRRAPQAARSVDRGRGGTAQARRPVHPGRCGAGARSDRAAGSVSAARIGHPRRAIRRLGGSPAGPFQRLVRDVSAVHRRVGPRRASPSTAPSPPPRRRCRASPTWVSTWCTCRRSIRSARCTARAATTR